MGKQAAASSKRRRRLEREREREIAIGKLMSSSSLFISLPVHAIPCGR